MIFTFYTTKLSRKCSINRNEILNFLKLYRCAKALIVFKKGEKTIIRCSAFFHETCVDLVSFFFPPVIFLCDFNQSNGE